MRRNKVDKDKVQQSIQLLLEGLGVDLDNTALQKNRGTGGKCLGRRTLFRTW